jgi:hypothetical protein
MSEQIQAGDLVVVVAPLECCGKVETLGHIFTVESVELMPTCCKNCGARDDKNVRAKYTIPGGVRGFYLLSRLKKIDPPAIPETIEHEERMPA